MKLIVKQGHVVIVAVVIILLAGNMYSIYQDFDNRIEKVDLCDDIARQYGALDSMRKPYPESLKEETRLVAAWRDNCVD